MFAFDVERADYFFSSRVEDGNNNFRASGTERGEVAGVGGHIANVYSFAEGNSGSCEALRQWKDGIGRRFGSAPNDVFDEAGGVIDVVESDPAVIAGSPDQVCDLQKRRGAIPRSRNDVAQFCEQFFAIRRHGEHFRETQANRQRIAMRRASSAAAGQIVAYFPSPSTACWPQKSIMRCNNYRFNVS